MQYVLAEISADGSDRRHTFLIESAGQGRKGLDRRQTDKPAKK